MRLTLFLLLICLSIGKSKDKEKKIEKLLDFVLVEGDTFLMGDKSQKNAFAHEVEVSSYYIQKTEVTQELWKAVMGYNPSFDSSSNQLPVTNVSWEDCQIFIQKLNTTTSKKYRLPTEAEWEFAARGGKLSKGFRYSGSEILFEVAWFLDNSKIKIHPVGQKKPNELGLFDMSGNAEEWCSDWFGEYPKEKKLLKNPLGPDIGDVHVIRGGSWYRNADFCLVYNHSWFPNYNLSSRGFRLVFSLE
jgi:formylglycine-generating enzyme required for sulfatase activity